MAELECAGVDVACVTVLPAAAAAGVLAFEQADSAIADAPNAPAASTFRRLKLDMLVRSCSFIPAPFDRTQAFLPRPRGSAFVGLPGFVRDSSAMGGIRDRQSVRPLTAVLSGSAVSLNVRTHAYGWPF
jgi:hypothetical protein